MPSGLMLGLNGMWGVGGTAAFAGDVDGDGLVDLVLKDPYDARIDGTLVAFAQPGSPTGTFPQAPIVQHVVRTYGLADVDGDGDSDIIGPRIVDSLGWQGPTAGGRAQYGVGIAGAGGVIPTLGETGPFRPGTSCELRIRGGVGGASGALGFGFASANIPLFGGTLVITPDVVIPIQLGGAAGAPGAGSFTIPFVMPPELAGVTVFKQAGVIDPAAPSGISGTNGLAIHVGN